jgi:hypothetical protein
MAWFKDRGLQWKKRVKVDGFSKLRGKHTLWFFTF